MKHQRIRPGLGRAARALWLLIFLVPATAAVASPPYGSHYYTQARALYEGKRYKEAIPLLNMAIDLSETARRRYLLGQCYEGEDDLEEALYHYSRAYELKPEKASADAILRMQRRIRPIILVQKRRGDGVIRTGNRPAAPPAGSRGMGKASPPVAFKPTSPFDWLRHPDATVRSSTARAFGLTRNSDAVPHLALLLKDREAIVRSSAAEALGKIGDPTVAKALVDALDAEERPTVQLSLLTAISAMPGSRRNREAVARLIARRPASVVLERAKEVQEVLQMKVTQDNPY